MRFAIALVLLTACGHRCGQDSAPETHEASTTVAAFPIPDAALAEAANARVAAAVDAAVAIDGGCVSAHDDAVARFNAFCANEPSCHAEDPELAPGSTPTKVPDLDGDGVPEIVWGWGPIPVNNESHLYRGGTACAAHLGSLGGSTDVHRKSTRHEGYADIVVKDYGICEGASGGCTPEINGYIFQAGQYEVDPKQHVAGTVKLAPETTQ